MIRLWQRNIPSWTDVSIIYWLFELSCTDEFHESRAWWANGNVTIQLECGTFFPPFRLFHSVRFVCHLKMQCGERQIHGSTKHSNTKWSIYFNLCSAQEIQSGDGTKHFNSRSVFVCVFSAFLQWKMKLRDEFISECLVQIVSNYPKVLGFRWGSVFSIYCGNSLYAHCTAHTHTHRHSQQELTFSSSQLVFQGDRKSKWIEMKWRWYAFRIN